MMGEPEEELRFLQEFAQQVGPAIYNVYLMRRLRERAGRSSADDSPANCMMERFNR